MRITFDEIARLAHVSKTTVSRVANGVQEGVSDKTRQHVLSVMEGLGYDPGSQVFYRAGGTKTIGLIVPDIVNPFFSAVSMTAGRYAASKGYVLFTCNTGSPQQEEAAISTMISKRMDGVILVTSSDEWLACHERLNQYQIPLVLMDRKIGRVCPAGVFVDNEYAFYMAASYLIRGGHHRIAMLCGPRQATTTQERIEGYRNAYLTCGLRYDESLIRCGRFDMESGRDLILQLAEEKIDFTAVLAGNDSIAVGSMRAMKDLGIRVPEDVELIGFDNTQLSEVVEPALSTIKQPVSQLGESAVAMLLQMIDGLTPEEPVIRLKSSLILRGTTRERQAGISI